MFWSFRSPLPSPVILMSPTHIFSCPIPSYWQCKVEVLYSKMCIWHTTVWLGADNDAVTGKIHEGVRHRDWGISAVRCLLCTHYWRQFPELCLGARGLLFLLTDFYNVRALLKVNCFNAFLTRQHFAKCLPLELVVWVQGKCALVVKTVVKLYNALCDNNAAGFGDCDRSRRQRQSWGGGEIVCGWRWLYTGGGGSSSASIVSAVHWHWSRCRVSCLHHSVGFVGYHSTTYLCTTRLISTNTPFGNIMFFAWGEGMSMRMLVGFSLLVQCNLRLWFTVRRSWASPPGRDARSEHSILLCVTHMLSVSQVCDAV